MGIREAGLGLQLGESWEARLLKERGCVYGWILISGWEFRFLILKRAFGKGYLASVGSQSVGCGRVGISPISAIWGWGEFGETLACLLLQGVAGETEKEEERTSALLHSASLRCCCSCRLVLSPILVLGGAHFVLRVRFAFCSLAESPIALLSDPFWCRIAPVSLLRCQG